LDFEWNIKPKTYFTALPVAFPYQCKVKHSCKMLSVFFLTGSMG